MALLSELGHKYPVSTDGVLIDLQDENQSVGPGDIVEAWYEADKDISYLNIAPAIKELIKMKEQYPDFVLHYIRFDTRRVYVQFSAAPPQLVISGKSQSISSSVAALTWAIVAMIAVIVAIIVAALAVSLRAIRGYWWTPPKPMGNLSVSAVGCSDEQCTSPEALDVTFSVAGKTYSTGGGTVLIKNLPVGPYDIIPGLPPEGYQPADPVTITIAQDQTTLIRLKYYAVGVTPPVTAWFVIDTSPVKGPVYVNQEEIGEAPVQVEVLPLVTYVVSFGDVSGYDTPQSQSHSLQRGERRAVNGKYEKVGWPEWAKWTVIGGGILVGGLVVVKTAELILARRE